MRTFSLYFIFLLVTILTSTVTVTRIRGPGMTQLTPQPPWASYEIPGDIGVGIWKEGGREESNVLCASSDFQSGDRVPTSGLGSASTRPYACFTP